MHVTISKAPDGHTFVTKDGFGDLYSGTVHIDGSVEQVGVDAEIGLRTEVQYGEPVVFGTFSWVDYKDTSTPDPHPEGVRHTHDFNVPGVMVFGPYAVAVVDDRASVAEPATE